MDAFSGKKSIVLAEVNWLGGRNLFLGIAYLVVGAFLVITAIALLIMHKLCSNWYELKICTLDRYVRNVVTKPAWGYTYGTFGSPIPIATMMYSCVSVWINFWSLVQIFLGSNWQKIPITCAGLNQKNLDKSDQKLTVRT